MRSFVDLDKTFGAQPRELGAILARIDTGKGQEQLFEDQMPELLGRLSENARVASITASNAIEGVIVDERPRRADRRGLAPFRNRNEREFAGYRDAIDGLMRLETHEPLSVPFVLHLHRRLFAHTGGNGGHLKSEQNLIVSYESGRREIVFAPPSPERPSSCSPSWSPATRCKARPAAHPLVLIGALILDFLAIHPLADGNGRLARLLTTYELLAQGYASPATSASSSASTTPRTPTTRPSMSSQRDWHEGDTTLALDRLPLPDPRRRLRRLRAARRRRAAADRQQAGAGPRLRPRPGAGGVPPPRHRAGAAGHQPRDDPPDHQPAARRGCDQDRRHRRRGTLAAALSLAGPRLSPPGVGPETPAARRPAVTRAWNPCSTGRESHIRPCVSRSARSARRCEKMRGGARFVPKVTGSGREPDAHHVGRKTRRDVERNGRMNPPLLAPPPPEAVPPTRSAPSLVITVHNSGAGKTEAAPQRADYWPEGIDYDAVDVPGPAPQGTFRDPLDTLDLLDD